MATSTQTLTAETLELQPIPNAQPVTSTATTSKHFLSENDTEPSDHTEGNFITSAVPDGGYGWTVVAAAFTTTFCMNALLNCWGVLQTALLNSSLAHVPASTVSFVGSVSLANGVFFGLLATRFSRQFGSRMTAMTGATLMGLGLLTASWSMENVAGLFVTVGFVAGMGISGVYTIANSLPVQYFSGKIGLANGLVKLGGGVGGTVMAIALEALVRRVGIAWTFRIQGLMTLAIGLPAAWLMKDRVSTKSTVSAVELSMFKSVPFTMVFLAGATGTFALFVPPYYLPLFAQSLGLSSSTGAGLVSAFNACNAVGRFVGGPLCDKVGPANMLVTSMLLNAVSMLAIWPVSNTLGPLIVFAIVNGVANGSFFTIFPTVVAGIFGPGRAAVAMSMSITGWTLGYLLGAPIAGYLLQAAGGQKAAEERGIDVYRPAIFYAGGIASVSSVFALVARIYMAKTVRKRV